MKESGLTVEKSAEKGAIRKTSNRQYEGTKQTEKRGEAELKKKKEDEEWLKECKARSDEWERKRLDYEERMKNTSAWVGGRSIQGKARKDEERAKARKRRRKETISSRRDMRRWKTMACCSHFLHTLRQLP